MRITTIAAMGAGLLALGLVSGCASENTGAATTSQAATTQDATVQGATSPPAAPPVHSLAGFTEDEEFEWALGLVEAKHPGGAESIRLGRGVCEQFDKVPSHTYGAMWLLKNSDGFYTKASQVSGLVAAAIAMYCPEHEAAITNDPGLTVKGDGKVSVDTGDSIGDLLPD